MLLGVRMGLILKKYKLTHQDFADAIGVNRSSIAGWLNGTVVPSAAVIYRICKTYNISANWLLGLNNNLV